MNQLTPIENQLLSFYQAQVQELDANSAAALLGMQYIQEDQQTPASEPHLRRYFLNELGQQQQAIAGQKWQAIQQASQQQIPPVMDVQQTTPPLMQATGMPPMLGDQHASTFAPVENTAIATTQPSTVGETDQPGQQNTVQTSLPEGTEVEPVAELMGFPIYKTAVREKKNRKPGEAIYPFDDDKFEIGMEFVVPAESNSDDDLKAVRKKLKSAANAANRRHREKTGEKEMVTKKKQKEVGGIPVTKKEGKKTVKVMEEYQTEVDVMRQTKKFTTEPLEPVGDQLGGVRVLRVSLDD